MCTEFQSLDSPSFQLRYFGLDSFFGFLHIKLCLNFAKFMELCQVLPKIWNYVNFLPKIWNYGKFCQKYRVMS
jgi:hypothetical protein